MRLLRIWALALLALWLGAGGVLALQRIDPRAPSSFAFVHITDVHQTAQGSLEPLLKLSEAASAMPIRPSFVVATGDITEAGTTEEYARAKQGFASFKDSRIDVFAVPGNHDTRWNPDGKRQFAKAFGKTYQSFDYEGTHFVLLDSTMRLSHWGHFDREQIEWLAKDLKKVSSETPIFLFLHHWMGRDLPDKRPIDNEYDLWPLLRGKNLIAIFTGHGHEDAVWKTRGVTTVMAKGLYQGSYHRVTVSPALVTIERISKERGAKPEVVARIPVKGSSLRSRMRSGWNDPDIPFLARRRPAAALEPRAFDDVTEGEVGEYRVDGGEWRPMKRDNRDIWSETFFTKDIAVGMHTATTRIITSNKEALEEELIFEVERDEKEPTRLWALDLKGGIQSSPALTQDRVFVSCLDGRIYAMERATGKQRWSYKTEGELVGSPVAKDGTVYVGSLDGNLYALDADSGRLKWKQDAGCPLVATPAIAAGVVCIGGRDKIIGVHLESGRLAWTALATGFFQSRAAEDGSAFYLGGWDNYLYALDAVTGNIRWKKPLGFAKNGKPLFYYAPAISSPAVANGRLYISSNDGLLHALQTSNGDEVWSLRAPSGSFGHASPAVYGGMIYIASMGDDGDVYGLDAATGNIRWQTKTGQTYYDSSPRLAPDGASLALIGVRGKVSVLDTLSGKRLWGYELGPGNALATPEYDGKTVYTTTLANDVQALNPPGAGRPIMPDRGARKRDKSR